VSENDFDEQWRIQQEQLAARRVVLDRDHLKDKHKGGGGGGGFRLVLLKLARLKKMMKIRFRRRTRKRQVLEDSDFPGIQNNALQVLRLKDFMINNIGNYVKLIEMIYN